MSSVGTPLVDRRDRRLGRSDKAVAAQVATVLRTLQEQFSFNDNLMVLVLFFNAKGDLDTYQKSSFRAVRR